ncbi:ATP phosphoribosyltransferase regulatory subunit [Falsirhodobacter halotolerans]|uniref:ATP phosphoribosyltransferase regulatory subunit n=1 Tax=Falsirhodobacter halotolerans TaxID=1146892 RepID=UPI001FD006AE|nr:ATP phosphoribosyltransferase regulatory subunit [Falsirhodobacter halotolerans]MCJ8138702.1 ATP phosphoribosyltransferase regulatory subunit [Falsirhodobacter halotolerans]
MTKAEVRAEAERLFAAFLSAGAEAVEADILLPADTLLDLYGEDIRARAYVTQDPLRGEMMLRPDFTVPVVQAHMAHGADPARYAYMGEVFRKQDHLLPRASEYLQVGFEVFDRTAPEQADAEVFALLANLLSPLNLRPATGDMAILLAAIRGLETTPTRISALLRHVWRPKRFRHLLDRYAGRIGPHPARIRLLKALEAGKLPKVGPHIGLRSAQEIAARIHALADDADTAPIPAKQVGLLEDLMTLSAPAPAALERLRDLAVDLPHITDAVEVLAARLSALRARGIDTDRLPFETGHGRVALEYYDGFVFSFHAADPALPPVANGGRYDALTRVLGQGRSIPAVGGVVRPHLVAGLGGLSC